MAKLLVTGMSGAGKSSALLDLARRGHRTVDTDSDEWCEWVTATDEGGRPEQDWVWRPGRITALLAGHREGHLFVAGCKSNQGAFYPLFDAVVLLTAPAGVLLERVATRTNNPYGQSAEDQARIRDHIASVEPLLYRGASAVIGTERPVSEVAGELETLARRLDDRM